MKDSAPRLLARLIRPDARPYPIRAAHGRDALDAILAAVGQPQHGLPVIQIVGSKGKGSTALMIEALLRAGTARVGTFTSPHLSRWSERIRLDGVPCADTVFADLLHRVERVCDAEPEATRGLRFFDALTAAALVLFHEQGVDWAVIEAGLGGVHDATAVVTPQAVVLTTVEREHTAELGEDPAGIAREKAGILRSGVPLTLGRLSAAARNAALAIAHERSCPVLELGHDLNAEHTLAGNGQTVRVAGPWGTYQGDSPLLFPHLADTLVLAMGTLWQAGCPMPNKADLDSILRTLSLPARCEWVSEQPRIMVDAAHTADSLRSTVRTLAAAGHPNPHLLLGFSAGKPLQALLDVLPASPHITLTQADTTRSATVDALAEVFRASARWPRIEPCGDPHLALALALAALPPGGTLLVTGSVYLAGVVREALSVPPPVPPRAVDSAPS